jgi:hypothetical protein
MRHFILLPVIFLLPYCIVAQISVETITTDTVNLFSPEEGQEKQQSSGVAMALSLLVPGMGHQYTARPNAALAYLTIDVLSLAGAIFGELFSRQLQTDSRGFASANAGIRGNIKNDRYWQMVGAYVRMEHYNNDLQLMRDLKDLYTQEEYMWNWNSDEARNTYNKTRDNSRKMQIVSSFCIGAMVLNRVIAFVDVRAATRYKNSVTSTLSVQPSLRNPGLTLSTEF